MLDTKQKRSTPNFNFQLYHNLLIAAVDKKVVSAPSFDMKHDKTTKDTKNQRKFSAKPAKEGKGQLSNN